MKANTTPSEQEFRNQLQRKLNEAECAPPPLVWERLENHLDSNRKKRRGLYWWTGIAASLFILSIGGWYFTHQGKKNLPENASLALNPVWLHPKPVAKNKKAASPIKRQKQDSEAVKPEKTPAASQNPVSKPLQFQPKLNTQTASTQELKPEMEHTLVTLSPMSFPNLLHYEEPNIDTSMAAIAQLQSLEPEYQNLPQEKSRKVYGIGIGKYKLKISLASKE